MDHNLQKQRDLAEERLWRKKNGKFLETQLLRAYIITYANRLKQLQVITSKEYQQIVNNVSAYFKFNPDRIITRKVVIAIFKGYYPGFEIMKN